MRPLGRSICWAAALLAASQAIPAAGAERLVETVALARLPAGEYLPFFKFSAGKGQTEAE